MIENIPIEGLYDELYKKIVDKMMKLRQMQLRHSYEINKIGTNSTAYSILDQISNPFRQNKKLRKYVIYALKKFSLYLKKRKKIQVSNIVDAVWTRDIVESSTLPYPVRRSEYPWAILNGKLEKNMKILDVGSGVSLFPVYLANEGYDIISVDPDKILMDHVAPKLAEFSGTNLEYKIEDVTKLSFDSDSFDRVFCISVIEHLEEEYINEKHINHHKKNLDVKAIGELLRVLKPGGLLVLTFDWNENKDEFRSYKLDDIYDRVLKPYKNNLLVDKKPQLNWDELKIKHLEVGKLFPPFNYITEGWAIGVILKK
jgi:2-polyprenyl-3-methyl-5-hydroxy-6-metoxy-1,4-benzoquinol methylase